MCYSIQFYVIKVKDDNTSYKKLRPHYYDSCFDLLSFVLKYDNKGFDIQQLFLIELGLASMGEDMIGK